jgi:hypothetical protein
MSLPISEVTEVERIGARFWSRLDGSVDAGFNYSRSSGIAQTTLNMNASYRRPAFLLQFTSSATVTAQSDGTGDDDRATAQFSYVRYRGRRLYVAGQGSLENNESLGLLLRSQVGGLIGQRLVNSNRAQFQVGGGLMVNDEKIVDVADSQNNLEGVLVMTTSFYTYDRPKTDFTSSVQYFPSLSDWGRQRLQIDSSVKRELWKDFFFGFTLYDSFDSAPPNPDAARNDVGVSISLGWSY